jgi:drug/metabolite transporter (DMT)-like permease
MHSRTKSLLEIHIAVFLFGAAGLFGKLLSLDATLIVLGRTFFATIALGLFLLVGRPQLRSIVPGKVGMLLLLGLLLAGHWWTFFYSIQVSTVAIGLLAFSSFPLFTAILEPLMEKTRIVLADLAIAGIVVLGLIIVVPEFSLSNSATLGVFWGMMSGLSFALLQILNRRYMRYFTPTDLSLGQMCFAFFALLMVSDIEAVFNLTGYEILLLLVLGIFCTALAHTLFLNGLQYVRAQLASVIAGLEPVYGILLGVLLLGELPTIRTIVGGVVILAAVIAGSLRPEPAKSMNPDEGITDYRRKMIRTCLL